MKIGILKAGGPPPAVARFGDYPAMFCKLLAPAGFEYVTFDVEAGSFPSDATACAGYIVTGSPHDAYADTPWIVRLRDFLARARGQAALVGVCFGHQVMAEAFGGRVAKATVGWGVGTQSYTIARPQEVQLDKTTLTLPAFHRDQVVLPPPGAEVVGGSEFCPYGILAYPGERAMSLQLHPEFEAEYAAALAETKRHHGLSDPEVDEAVTSARLPTDRNDAGQWITRFLRHSAS